MTGVGIVVYLLYLFCFLIFYSSLGCTSIAGRCSLIILYILLLLFFNSFGIHHIDRGDNHCIFCVDNFCLTMAQVSGDRDGMIYYCNSSHLKSKNQFFFKFILAFYIFATIEWVLRMRASSKAHLQASKLSNLETSSISKQILVTTIQIFKLMKIKGSPHV